MSYIGQEPGQGQAQRSIFTAVAVTDTVTADDDSLPLNYTVGQVSVYLNGVKQVVGDDVVASNGSTLVFASDYAIGDVIEVIALDTFSVGTVEGTAIISTGESGGTKFLREDGDATSSWQVPTDTVGVPGISSTGSASSDTVTFAGNFTVNGTTSYINTTTVEVEDNILQLNTTQASPDTATAATSGISVYRGNGVTQASLIFDDADDAWDITNNLVLGGDLETSTTGKVKQKGAFMQSSTHQALTLGY
jgi:hypothetical protein